MEPKVKRNLASKTGICMGFGQRMTSQEAHRKPKALKECYTVKALPKDMGQVQTKGVRRSHSSLMSMGMRQIEKPPQLQIWAISNGKRSPRLRSQGRGWGKQPTSRNIHIVPDVRTAGRISKLKPMKNC